MRELDEAWQASEADYFSKSSDSLMNFDQDSFSWKTCQLSLFEDSTESPLNLPAFGMIVGGRLFQPPTLEPRTCESVGSCLRGVPTATATDAKSSRNLTVKNRNSIGNPGMTLTDYVTLFPTPTASVSGTNGKRFNPVTQKSDLNPKPGLEMMARHNLWPTPRAQDGPKGGPSQGDTLPAAVGGKLNPTWVEWLMNFPSEWTALDASETQWFRSKRKRHSNDSQDLGESA